MYDPLACLDAFAWLAWLPDEPGAAAVQHWLAEADAARAECITSVTNLGEAYYRLVRVGRSNEADTLWRITSTRRPRSPESDRMAFTIRFRQATLKDVPAIAALHNSVAGALTAKYGEGHWSKLGNERGAELAQRHAVLRVGCDGRRVLTAVRLATKKPWAIDVGYFTPVRRPLYLTGMAVSVARWGEGLGRLALGDARQIAEAWPAEAIRLDAYDAPAGGGGFYEKCGFQRRGRVVYRTDPLVYYELLLT